MMSSMVWANQILSPGTLHSVFDMVLRRCVTSPIAAADRWPTSLTPGCSSHVVWSC
jgi:hypothetical protein